ncbi:unnamed protein product [Lampetra planeri]
MPLVVMCGLPCSGKTRRALQLESALLQMQLRAGPSGLEGRSVAVVPDTASVSGGRDLVYGDSSKEKEMRGALKSEVERKINKQDVVIVDSLNYIKGCRYELYCIIKHAQTPHCLIHCDTAAQTCSEWNQQRSAEERYTQEVLDALVMRFEAPDSRNRWDSPLITVQPLDAFPLEAVCDALFHRKAPVQNQATLNSNFLLVLCHSMSSQAGVDGRRGECSFPEPLPGPPATAEEFLRPQNLENWPRAVTWDAALRLDSPFGMEEDSADENLRAAAPLDTVPLERLEERASRLACELRLLADKVLLRSTDDQQQQRQRWPKTQDAAAAYGVGTFITQTDECGDVWSHRDNELTQIQDCSFPEYLGPDAVADLPQSLDPGHLLENCFDAQAFQPHRHWKQLFTSGSSHAIVRDTFWWIFLSRYKGGANQELENHLYDRVAKSFVSLLLSTPHNMNNKDKFLQAYVEWLAQVLYGAFVKAFPASRLQFGDDFKAELANLTSLWICGIQAKPLSWKTWDLSWLGESLKTAQKTPTGERQGADAVLEISHLHDNYSSS